MKIATSKCKSRTEFSIISRWIAESVGSSARKLPPARCKHLIPKSALFWILSSVVINLSFCTTGATADNAVSPADKKETPSVSPAKAKSPAAKLQFQVSGRDLLVVDGSGSKKTFHINEPASLPINNEIVDLTTGPNGLPTAVLGGSRAADMTVLPGSLDASSVQLKTESGQKLENGKDFKVDSSSGTIELVAPQTFTKVVADYKCWLTRLDTLVVDQAGNLAILEGVPLRSAPLPPAIPAGQKPLANILSRWCNQPLAAEDVMRITAKLTPPDTDTARNTKVLTPLSQKLKSGQPINLVFWGDSITAGFCADPLDKSFPSLVVARLKSQFPTASIEYKVNGFTGRRAKDVMKQLPEALATHPDLLVVEFVNDLSTPVRDLNRTYASIVEACRESQTCLMLVTPHFTDPSMAKAQDWQSIADNPYIALIHELGATNDLAVADVSWRWQHLSSEGLRADIMLVNLLNHPNNRGHEIYAEEILRCITH